MKKIKISISLWISIFAVVLANAGNVSIQANPQTAQKGQSVSVILTAQGKNITFPSIDHIGSYPIDTPQISQNIKATMVNGSFSSSQQKTMRFTFFPDKNITIPSFAVTVDGTVEHTHPLAIKVTTASTAAQGQNGYRLEMIPSAKNVYVGQPVVLNVVFFEPRNSQIAQAQYVPPKFDGFFVKSDNQERLKQDAQGTSHIFTYILTPQKEGNFTITAPQIKLGIKTFSGANDPWGFFNNDVRWQALQAAPVTIHIRPIPANVDLIGNFKIQASVDTRSIRADKPVNYTLSIDGTGSLDDIDDPKFDLGDVTVYSNDAQVQSQIQNGQIISHWVKKYTFIADHDFTIPSLKEKVFNPKSGKVSTLTTPSFPIHVTGSTTGNASSHSQTPPPQTATSSTVKSLPVTTQTAPQTSPKTTSAHKDDNRSLLEDTAWYAQQAKETAAQQWPLWALILAFLTGVVTTLIAINIWPKIRREGSPSTRHRHHSIDEALAILYPHTNDSPEIEAMVRKLYRAKQDPSIKIDKVKLEKIINHIA